MNTYYRWTTGGCILGSIVAVLCGQPLYVALMLLYIGFLSWEYEELRGENIRLLACLNAIDERRNPFAAEDVQ